jgi:uncharacterized membrane protein
MNALRHYWLGNIALARPYFLLRIVLCVLAFDAWLNWMPRGARYGVGNFNVAHFPWLDGFVPGAGFYMGLLAFTSVLALSQALYRPNRLAVALVAAGYSFAWACSLLDSTPFHYLLSLYLICFVCFPMAGLDETFGAEEPELASAWGYVLFCVTTAIVYFYTAAWAAAEDRSYMLPMLCCIGYLLAATQDRLEAPLAHFAIPALGLAPLLLHGAALISHGSDPWPQQTMIAIALSVFAPKEALHGLGRVLSHPARRWGLDRSEDGADEQASRLFYVSLIGLCVAPMISTFVELPGVKTGTALTAIAMLFVTGHSLYLTPRFRPLWRVLSLFAACLAFFLTVTRSEVRAEYYRQGAADAQRRGDLHTARDMAEKAEQFER